MTYSSLKLVVGVIGIGTLLSGCASFMGAEDQSNVEKLQYGMSKNEVISLLGTPDAVVPEPGTNDRWIYEYRTSAKRGHNLFVEFNAEGISKRGELDGREIASAEESSNPGNCTKWPRVGRQGEFIEQSLCTK